ncbi:DUF4114 domain-containing protein [Pacificimonas sp. WHA3]|uniref:DUF4114 domain-containing protein n=1 Tax=Pacificimonas pallii TaxID=2827236 RepID=A0ABS6SH61_9SPHN|nr:DUF4114 domain-containing protein [Pacificimonas pallii]MBV7257752.1 DUF4114 domain-containing protein [Pacificimonas pallii]
MGTGLINTPSGQRIDISENTQFLVDWTEDASRAYYNYFLRLDWGGDRAGEIVGGGLLKDTDTERAVSFDIDAGFLRGNDANFLIRRDGGINAGFHSRESQDVDFRPVLEVTYADGVTRSFNATRDTYFDNSTGKPLGDEVYIKTVDDILIAFDGFAPNAAVQSARIVLTTTARQFGDQQLTVHAAAIKSGLPDDTIDVPVVDEADLLVSITGAEILDGLGGLDDDRYQRQGDVGHGVSLPGTNHALNRSTQFEGAGDTLYAVEIVRFDRNWDPSFGGKAGGISNSHADGLDAESANGSGGYGGNGADGDSWSFRLNFKEHDADNPLADDYLSLGTYGYYLDNGTFNGAVTPGAVPVPKGEFVALQHMVKLNTVREDGTSDSDGEFALWVNGILSVHLTGIKIRDYAPLKQLGVSFEDFLENSRPHNFWHNYYFGGVGYELVEHGAHLVSLGQLYVGSGLPAQSVIQARVDELNAGDAVIPWGAYADLIASGDIEDPNAVPDEIPGLPVGEDGRVLIEGDLRDDLFVATGVAERFSGGRGADLLMGSAEDLNGDIFEQFEAGDSLFIQDTARGDVRADVLDSGLIITLKGGETIELSLAGETGNGAIQLGATGTGGVFVRFVEYLPELAEASAVAAAAVNGIVNPHFLSGANTNSFEIEVGTSEAGNANSLGVYKVGADGSISDVEIIASNVKTTTGTVRIDDVEADETLGFFIIQDGANRLSAEVLASDALGISIVDGVAVLTDGGIQVDSATIFLSHDSALNSDGMTHVLSGITADGDALALGFEDLARGAGSGSDDDFQDVVFTVEAIVPDPNLIIG